ncbi:AraC family transcriptional regulator [Janthinobacterium sp. PLB04]|uniref:AraC family transcriptional regulator n=1 Tax=Janthinobacterium lividum TaxID=29581 RepID=A0AAJ4MRJ0_9BURK|nr:MULTISPECIES: AraC family transcriptional regulator [Janthinobacterium]KAB0326668.1 AraC family transcriptional regulator [Janthinobacterium lividum]QSX95799.1 AraC family transcriptional regulator [Janthinobacterium lividum]UGQ35657.1 AraC family transcriptional regulator [Janthinobacterium sp. PLB04]
MPGTTAFWRDPSFPHVESRRACHSRACYKPHSHPTFSIGAVDAGGSIFTGSKDGKVALGNGSLVLVPAGCVHACNPLPDAPWSYQMLHLDARWLQAHALALDGDTATVLRCPLLYAQFCAMNALLFSRAGAAEKNAALLAFLGACASACADVLPSERKPLPQQLAPVLATLQAQPSASLRQLAEAAGLSPYQLIRAFRAATGLTPHAYQLNMHVNRARSRLQEGTALAQLAHELGFADQSHLQRVFKAHAGITPGRYR